MNKWERYIKAVTSEINRTDSICGIEFYYAASVLYVYIHDLFIL